MALKSHGKDCLWVTFGSGDLIVHPADCGGPLLAITNKVRFVESDPDFRTQSVLLQFENKESLNDLIDQLGKVRDMFLQDEATYRII